MVIKALSKSVIDFLLEKDLEKQRVPKCSTSAVSKSLHPKQVKRRKCDKYELIQP